MQTQIAAFLASTIGRLIIGVGGALAILLSVQYCQGQRQKAEQAKQESRSDKAVAETAKEAAARVIEQAGEEAEIDELVAETAKEIENAKTPRDARRAATAAICRMPNYRDDPACKLQ